MGNCNLSAEVETPFGLSALVIIRFDPSAHLILTKLVSICEWFLFYFAEPSSWIDAQQIMVFVGYGAPKYCNMVQIVFLVKGPLYLVAISATEEPAQVIRWQLELLHAQVRD